MITVIKLIDVHIPSELPCLCVCEDAGEALSNLQVSDTAPLPTVPVLSIKCPERPGCAQEVCTPTHISPLLSYPMPSPCHSTLGFYELHLFFFQIPHRSDSTQ